MLLCFFYFQGLTQTDIFSALQAKMFGISVQMEFPWLERPEYTDPQNPNCGTQLREMTTPFFHKQHKLNCLQYCKICPASSASIQRVQFKFSILRVGCWRGIAKTAFLSRCGQQVSFSTSRFWQTAKCFCKSEVMWAQPDSSSWVSFSKYDTKYVSAITFEWYAVIDSTCVRWLKTAATLCKFVVVF